MSSVRLLVVVNNAAARARSAWTNVREALERGGVDFKVHWLGAEPDRRTSPEETERVVREGLRAGYDTVAVIGGDGTLSAAVSGFFDRGDYVPNGAPPRSVNPAAILAIVPAGTGDDFARGLSGGKRKPADDWIAKLMRHCRDEAEEESTSSPARVDVVLGSADDGARRFVCLNAATLGVGAEVAARVSEQGETVRRLPGEVRFSLAAMKAIAAWRNRRVRVRIDESEWEECRTNLVAVCNGPFAGSGMNFAPGARTDDGLLDVVTASDLTRGRVVREMARIHRGGHVVNPRVRIQRGSRVRIESLEDELMIEADGDVRGHTPAEFVIMPASLLVLS